MEFRESLMRYVIQKPIIKTKKAENDNGWKISLYRSSSSAISHKKKQIVPTEFLCPLSGSLMADPVIVSSGHTFERNIVAACVKLGFTPALLDGTTPDFSAVIPNLALRSTILKFCETFRVDCPTAVDLATAEMTVRALINLRRGDKNAAGSVPEEKEKEKELQLIDRVLEKPALNLTHAATELNRRRTHFYTSSEKSVGARITPPLPLATRPSCCYSSSDDSEINPSCSEEEEIVSRLKSAHVHEVDEAVTSLRKTTRTREESRVSLCTPRLLSVLKCLILSRYSNIQVNAVAALVNLSLEKVNKVKIVRSGIVPPLINVLKGGIPEVQEHASGALFSLSLDDANKTAIGVLGALQPLLHAVRVGTELTRNDSALALYHLTLVKSNRTKLVQLGAVGNLLGMLKSGYLVARVMLIVCNLAACTDGRAALLDAGGVECLVGLLRGNKLDSAATRESCVAGLYGLIHGGLRFKGLAKEAGLVEVLRKVEVNGTDRAKEKVRKILEVMRERIEEEEEEVDWEELLELGPGNRNRGRLGCAVDGSNAANSSEF